jgi:hypothetical protein
MRTVGERLPPPLMTFAPPDGFADFPPDQRDLAALGFRLAAASGTAFAAMVKAVRQSYECLAQGKIVPFIGKGNVEREMKAAMTTTGLDRLIEIEQRTIVSLKVQAASAESRTSARGCHRRGHR